MRNRQQWNQEIHNIRILFLPVFFTWAGCGNGGRQDYCTNLVYRVMIVVPPTTWTASKERRTNRICDRTFLNGWKSVWDKWSSWLTQSGVNVVDFQCGFFYSSSRRSLAERADQKTEAKEIWASVSFPVIFPNFSNTYIRSAEELPHLSCTLLSTCAAEERPEVEM